MSLLFSSKTWLSHQFLLSREMYPIDDAERCTIVGDDDDVAVCRRCRNRHAAHVVARSTMRQARCIMSS